MAKAKTCIGMTYAQLQARCIALAVERGLSVTDADAALAAFMAIGVIKVCSVHPGFYISDDWQRRRKPRERVELTEGNDAP